jgi:hypothetical protein
VLRRRHNEGRTKGLQEFQCYEHVAEIGLDKFVKCQHALGLSVMSSSCEVSGFIHQCDESHETTGGGNEVYRRINPLLRCPAYLYHNGAEEEAGVGQ